ncbi:MAG: glycosyltransferase family 39 protein [Candidatus Omnitrophota bacterium]
MKKYTVLLILLMAASAILLINLGAGSLSSWDEAFYAQVSREMLQNNNWIDLTWGGLPWSDKPPLFMWGTALFYKMFGINEFSARLFSALAGILTVLFTYLLAVKIFSKRTGILAAVMLISTYHFLWFGKSGTLDVTFTLFTLSSVYFFLMSEEKRTNIIYSFICFSLAFLTKGVGALLIPMILGLYVILWRKWYLIINRYALLGIFISLIVLGGWYVPAYLHYGDSFIKSHFLQNLVMRTAGAMDGHYGSWITYINVVLYKGKPWGAAGLIALPFLLVKTIKKQEAYSSILIIWTMVVLGIFSIVKTKLHWYIMPVYPAVMIIAAWGAEKVFKRSSTFIVIACSFAALVYFGMRKDIFILDFNPEIKKFAYNVEKNMSGKENVYLYNVGDPGMKFYFGGFGENIHSEERLKEVCREEKIILVTDKSVLKSLDMESEIIVSGPSNTGAFRVNTKRLLRRPSASSQ